LLTAFLVVSHAFIPPVAITPRRGITPPDQPQPAVLFRNAVRRLKAVRKLLAVLVACVVRQHLLARGALERLEARFALDGLRGGVLETLLANFLIPPCLT
jgi:hypothetical protein